MDPSNSSYYANLPAGAPPPGVISNFDHAESRAIEAYIGMGICIGVTLIFVTLRVYVKLAITHHWGWDDCKFFNMWWYLEPVLKELPRGLYTGIRKRFAHSSGHRDTV